jgi:hypothetical protein
MQPGGTRLGTGIGTGRRCNRSVSEHATHDLVMTRPRIEEDFTAGMAEEVRIEPQARETEYRPGKL